MRQDTLARTMHKFSAAAKKSSGVLHRLRDPQSGCPSAWRNALRSALSSLGDENLCIVRGEAREKRDRRQDSLSPLSALNERDSLGTELLDQASVHPTGLACLGLDFVPRLSFIGHLELFAPLHRCDDLRTGGG